MVAVLPSIPKFSPILSFAWIQAGKTRSELGQDGIALLETIANTNLSTGGAQARGILEAAYGYYFCNCLTVSDTASYKSSGSFGSDSFNPAFGGEIDVKPNPASDWVTFEYALPDTELEGLIKISDVTGKLIKTFTVTGTQGQKVWDTRKIDSGIYFYKFTVNGISKSGKLVINK